MDDWRDGWWPFETSVLVEREPLQGVRQSARFPSEVGHALRRATVTYLAILQMQKALVDRRGKIETGDPKQLFRLLDAGLAANGIVGGKRAVESSERAGPERFEMARSRNVAKGQVATRNILTSKAGALYDRSNSPESELK